MLYEKSYVVRNCFRKSCLCSIHFSSLSRHHFFASNFFLLSKMRGTLFVIGIRSEEKAAERDEQRFRRRFCIRLCRRRRHRLFRVMLYFRLEVSLKFTFLIKWYAVCFSWVFIANPHCVNC